MEFDFRSLTQLLKKMYEEEVIDEEFFNEALELTQFRNRLVHDVTVTPSEQEIQSTILRMQEFIGALGRSWKEEIVDALTMLGGEADLSEIYDYIESNSHRRLPQSWKATVRYVLQLNSSDTQTFKKGGTDLFRHLDRGRWGLRDSSSEL